MQHKTMDESGVRANGGPSWKWIAGGLISVLLLILSGVFGNLFWSVRENTALNQTQQQALTRIETQYGYITNELGNLKAMIKDIKP